MILVRKIYICITYANAACKTNNNHVHIKEETDWHITVQPKLWVLET